MDNRKNLYGSTCNRVHYKEFFVNNNSVFLFLSTRYKSEFWIGLGEWRQSGNARHQSIVKLLGNFFTKQGCSIHFNGMKVVEKTLLDKQSRFRRRFVSYIFSAHHCKCLWLNSSKVMLPDLSALLISATISSSVTSTFGSGKSQLIFFVWVVAIVLKFPQNYKLFWIWNIIPTSFFPDVA